MKRAAITRAMKHRPEWRITVRFAVWEDKWNKRRIAKRKRVELQQTMGNIARRMA